LVQVIGAKALPMNPSYRPIARLQTVLFTIVLDHLSASVIYSDRLLGGGREIAQRLAASAAELRALRQVHLVLDAAQLRRGETPLRRILDDRVPVPLGQPSVETAMRVSRGRRDRTAGAALPRCELQKVAAFIP